MKLDAFRSVAEANIDMLENNALLHEQLNLRMQMVQDLLTELDTCETSGDQIEYDYALGSAKIVIKDISDLINRLLAQIII